MDPSANITELDMLLRLALGFLAGAFIGFERSSRRQVAGLRTHILIATGSTMLMLLSIYLPQQLSPLRAGDPGRIAAQVVSGIGFLGAGAIIRLGNSIRGLTTAASLWFVAALGLLVGSGLFLIAGAAIILALFTLIILHNIERRIFPTERIKMLEVSYKENIFDTKEVLDLIKKAGIKIQSMDVNQSSNNKKTRLRLLVQVSGNINIAHVAQSIKSAENVGRVEIKEKY